MAFPPRNKHTFWYNEKPITDLNEALHLLDYPNWSDEPSYLARRDEADGWEIITPWYSEGDSGGDTSGNYYLQIDRALGQKLFEEKLVEPRRINYVGGFWLDDTQLVLTKDAKKRVETFHAEQRERARALLKPGVHTDLTGVPEPMRRRREQTNYGRLYFDFRCPNDTVCRIYPETGEVIFPHVGT